MHLVNKEVYENGLILLTEKIPYTRSLAIGVWVKTGARYEDKNFRGASHFIEHLLFKGTINRTAYDIVNDIESIGGVINAFTSKELTCYYVRVLDEYLDIALDVLSDLILNPLFDKKDFNKEKEIIIEEIKSIEDSPEEYISERFSEDLFQEHPLGHSIAGNIEEISTLSLSNIKTYYHDNYFGGNIVIAIAGNIEFKEAKNLVSDKFGDIKYGELLKEKFIHTDIKKEKKYYKDIGQAHLMIGKSTISYSDERKFAYNIANSYLNDGMSSFLFQNIREKFGLAYTIGSFIETDSDYGLFAIYGSTSDKKLDKFYSKLKKELSELKKNGISKEDCEKLKRQLKGHIVIGSESLAARMNRLAKLEIYLNKYYSIDDILNFIEKTTYSEINDALRDLLDFDKYTEIFLLPNNTNF